MNRSQLRTEKLAERDKQGRAEISRKSRRIHKYLFQLPQLFSAKQILLYLHFRSEVETQQLLEVFIEMGKIVSVPLCHPQKHLFNAVRIQHPKTELAPGFLGILEPVPEISTTGKIDPDLIDLIIIPGSVFDLQGGRLGYGGGYYDRFLERAPGALRVALAFALQLTEKLSLQPHDQRMDFIITEQGIISCVRANLVNTERRIKKI